ncbi:hypothetical protein X772_30060 [Mesorhizobium sp. LSJC280B00]|nr:hypothetical protein X772_30060 [Mesorhizobium sp. LSJC280B00]
MWLRAVEGLVCDSHRRGQEINQQLNQPAVLTSCFEMVRAPRTLFVAVKKVGSGQQPDVSYNVLTTQTQNLR